MHTTSDDSDDHETSGDARDRTEDHVPDEVRKAIADATTADTHRHDLLSAYAEALGPDPALGHLDDDEVEHAVRIGAAEIAAATCRWLEHLAELVIRGVWAVDGSRTPATWLSWALGMAPSTAREHVRVALRLRECPLVKKRFGAGRLSYSKARAITRVATPETEQLLLDWSDAAPAHVLERIIADARRQQHTEAAPTERDDLGVSRRWRDDGTYELILRVGPDEGIELEQSLDRLVELDESEQGGDSDAPQDDGAGGRAQGDDDTAPGHVPQKRREADLVLGAVAAAVSAGPSDTSGADRHLVILHTTAEELLAAAPGDEDRGAMGDDPTASAEAPVRRSSLVRDGRGRVRAMSAKALWRLACSTRLELAVDRSDGHPADRGRTRREPDARLRRLLLARDRTCRFPGCGATRFLHAHHVQHWADDGPTDLSNLVLLCRHHHAVVHDRRWQLRPAAPGRWTFHAPDREEPRRWSGELPGASAGALMAVARAHSHDLDPAGRARLLQPPHWDGDDYDHSLTVGILVERLATAA